MDPFVSIVVPTRNRAMLLEGCVDWLLKQDYPADRLEIIIVDDGSNDRTPSVARDLQNHHPVIRYVRREHRGLNATRNGGIGEMKGEVVAFIDDDELAPADYLSRTTQLLQDSPDVAGVGGPYRDYGHSNIRTCSQCSIAGADLPGRGRRVVPYLLGGNMVLRRHAFEHVGLFDEGLSGKGDDMEWFHRAKGLSFLYDPDLWVWHRRDKLSLWSHCRTAFRQGLAYPLFFRKIGHRHRPRIAQIFRFLGHAVLRRCGGGLIFACMHMGWAAQFSLMRLRPGHVERNRSSLDPSHDAESK